MMLSLPARAQVVPLPSFNVDIKGTSVSGLSSGGYMAVQFEVAYSSFLKGAGIIAGGPYSCALGNVITATSVCSCTGIPFLCRVAPGATNVPGLIRITDQNATTGAIDQTSNLSSHKIWMFSGTADTLVPQPIMDDLEIYYRHYISTASNIAYKKDTPAQHAMPTDFFGNACGNLGTPYINNCNFDAAGELLNWIYGGLNPKNMGALTGQFIEFDQKEFFDDHRPTDHGMADSGFLYVPASCNGSNNQPCRLHIVFHGCLQDPTNIQDMFVKNTGYNKWADTNNLIVIYPQAAPIFPQKNPNACWDWFNYDDPNYATKIGRQMVAAKRMVDRITGSGPQGPGPGSTATCITATNFDHVQAGRAHDQFFMALANGSNDVMGPDNIFIMTTLKEASPGFFQVASCR